MNKLFLELQRLYFLDGQTWLQQKPGHNGLPAHFTGKPVTPDILGPSLAGEQTIAINLVSENGMTRAMVVNFDRSSDWSQVAALYQAVQSELDLPAPAVTVSAGKGYGLWFSLAAPIPLEQAHVFLKTMRAAYLADLLDAHLSCCPDPERTAETAMTVVLPPSRHIATDKWSAFIDPSMGEMFVDEPWLEMAPNMSRQADMLERLESISITQFNEALLGLQAKIGSANQTEPKPQATAPLPVETNNAHMQNKTARQGNPDVPKRRSTLNVGHDYNDPVSFLQAVMNDPSASARSRIAAATALLPYLCKKSD